MNGLVLIDKPGGCTSHDVVNRWRRMADMKRVGHLGTLDPMATGLLALLTGTATRLAQFFGRQNKTYICEITFGMTSDTYDVEGKIAQTGCLPEADAVLVALGQFRGRFLQTPPPVSAKKIKGTPAYKLHRNKVEVKLEPVEVEVTRLNVLKQSLDKLEMEITCGAGTYIRAIAHDLGVALGCGAVLSKLRRTEIGSFTVEQARTLDELKEMAQVGQLNEAVTPSRQLLPEFPAEYFDIQAELQIRQGRDFRTSPFVVRPGAPFVKALSHSGDLIAVGEMRIPNVYHPSTVL